MPKHGSRRQAFSALLGLLVSVVAHAQSSEVYRYHGLKVAEGPAAVDGVYNNFTADGYSVGLMWADADARQHKSADHSWVRAHVVRRDADKPFLRVHFVREGYGANIGVVPMGKVPERVPGNGAIVSFSLRSHIEVCAGVRLMEGDGEIWGYGPKLLDYNRLCVAPKDGWRQFEIPMAAGDNNWFKFIYSGNTDLGNGELDADLLASLSFELGLDAKHHLGNGEGVLDIGAITVRPALEATGQMSSQTASDNL